MWLCVVANPIVCAAGEVSDAPFASPGARNAAESYGSALLRLQREFEEKAAVVRKAYVTQLTAAKDAATRSGNLDEAVRIRDAIEKLAAQAQKGSVDQHGALSADRLKLARQLGGTVWQTGAQSFKFNDDGTGIASGRNETFQWVPINGRQVYMEFSAGWTNRLDFDEQVGTFTFQELANGTKKDEQAGKRLRTP
jgi:hypothetical protein